MAIRSLKTGQFSRSALVGNPVIMPGSYESIATVTVGSGGAANIEFTSIPSTFTHLQVRWISRSAGSTANRVRLNINNDTTSAHWHLLYGTGTAAAAYTISTGYIEVAPQPVSTDTSNIFGGGILDILDYKNTNKNKTTRGLSGDDRNGSGLIFFNSGAYYSTTAISSLKFTPATSENFAQHTTFALYGVN